jgi:hypothetical protein
MEEDRKRSREGNKAKKRNERKGKGRKEDRSLIEHILWYKYDI